MLKSAQEILNKIEDNGYEAFIVGGFVRDYYIGKKSLDVDICTNATPKELSDMFEGVVIPSEKYGAVTLIYNKVRYEITTYRREVRYDDYRRPIEIEYVSDLLDDLKRRDFTVNTMCMNSKGEIIDLLKATDDLNGRVIRTVGNANIKLREDVLRILRAVRFATSLNFTICNDVKEAIITNGPLLKNLSYMRKKEELTKIFASPNAAYGVSLLLELKLDKYLELSNLSNLKLVDDILGIWAQLDVLDIYPFSRAEKETITKVKEALSKDSNDNYVLYQYGLYIMSITASIKKFDKKVLNERYNNLPIKGRGEIDLDAKELCHQLNIEPGYWLKKAYDLIEKEIIYGNIENTPEDIYKYITNHLNNILIKQ
ncbi:MAG: CCA tRNA nucleotidyltransferase [Bacilli bacterium]